MERLIDRLSQLESELLKQRGRNSQVGRSQQVAERRLQELQMQRAAEEQGRVKLEEMAQGLEAKMRGYRKQAEEAQEIAALNLAKYRKAQQQLEEAEARAALAENRLAASKLKP